jgi:hypothetical protein
MVLASARLRGIHLTLIVLKMADVHGGGGGGGGGGGDASQTPTG